MSRSHGMTGTPIYRVYRAMLTRCYYPSDTNYKWYGAKGICVCDRWRGAGGFERWLADMGPRPDGMTLDRKDPRGDYEPDNCRWATTRTQSINRTNNRHLTAFGRTQTLHEWCEETGLRHNTVLERLKRGWTVEESLSLDKSYKNRWQERAAV